MKVFWIFIACGLVCALNLFSNPRLIRPDITTIADRAVNRTATVLSEDDKRGLRLSEGPGQGLIWVPNLLFSTGSIEVDVRGKDIFQKSFVGIAFHGIGDTRYEVVYLRPFNFRTNDPVRHSHALQYAFHPDFAWAKLRTEHPGEFETEVPATLEPNDWVHLRVEASADRIRVFIGDAKIPSLNVSRLSTANEGSVGLWVGEGSGGDFANLKIESSAGRSNSQFPVTPEVFIDRFEASEGITFNGEGQLFIGADSAVWIVEPDGNLQKIADVHTHLGQAGIGQRDILAADFGPTNVFEHGPNHDGIVWRITPKGDKTVVASGIADPNFIVVLPDKTFLVSDDGTDKIYRVSGGSISIWSTAVDYPNGMVLSLDSKILYVAQIFSSLKPIVGDNRLWTIQLTDKFVPFGPPGVAARTGEGGIDGLAMDEVGRIYVADNGGGKIWRFDPKSSEVILIAEGMPGVASLVFGEGNFDQEKIYATSTRRGGGKIWKIPVGVKGAKLNR
ncbi:SMP-30/gluconolactonase/LRE family protein [bacterium]|nr:SMP-30/gluconolactonase/LRE family protein [bacterium]